MVSAPIRQSANVVEKYINQRTQAFTRTHARALQQWLDGGRGTEAEYWAEFRREVERSQRRWERDAERIDSDPNMTFREKREEKNRLTRVWPAWSLEQEEAFIKTYGDPHANGRLQAAVDELQDDQWYGALREGQPRDVPKHEWERKFYDFLTNPQDGSIPVFVESITPRGVSTSAAAPEAGFEARSPSEPAQTSTTSTGVVISAGPSLPLDLPDVAVPEPSFDGFMSDREKREYQKQAETLIKRMCPRCFEVFPSGLKPQHIDSERCRETVAKRR